MRNIKNSKLYKMLKRLFFVIILIPLEILRVKKRIYYYSKWVADNGEETLLIDYPLKGSSVVIDVGGYTGSFSDNIIKFYNPQLTILEPVKEYFNILKSKYSNKKNIILRNYGLSNKNSSQKIYLSDDGSSLIKKSKKTEKIKLVDALYFLKKYRYIDLISINIEGAEYEVVQRIIETGIIKKIKYLQIQFHSFIPDANIKRKNILNRIQKTHNIHFSYPYVWESFKIKK